MTIFIEFIALSADYLILYTLTLAMLSTISYALFNSKRNLSAIIAINSEFVGLPFAADIVYPKIFSTVFCSPLPQATSIA